MMGECYEMENKSWLGDFHTSTDMVYMQRVGESACHITDCCFND